MDDLTSESGKNKLILFSSIIFILSGSTSQIGSFFGYMTLFFLVLFGPVGIITAYFLLWFSSVANPAIFHYFDNSTLRYLIIFTAVFITVINKIKKYKISGKIENFDLVALTILSIGLMHSIFFSYYPVISLLKFILWVGVFYSLYYSFNDMGISNFIIVESAIFKLLVIIILISSPLIFIKQIGYFRNDLGFQGILNHPQAYGVLLVLVGSFLINKALRKSEYSKLYFLAYLTLLIQSYLTKSRISVVMLLALTCLVIFKTIGNDNYHTSKFIKNKFFIFLIIMFFSLNINSGKNFMLKQSGSENIVEALKISRLKLINPMLENVSQNPIFGIGFGVSSRYQTFRYERDPNIGIPYRTYNEKGLIYLQIVEELGSLLGSIILFYIAIGYKKFWNYDPMALSLITAVLLVNFGESIFFSSGGLGMICIIIVSLNLNKLYFYKIQKK